MNRNDGSWFFGSRLVVSLTAACILLCGCTSGTAQQAKSNPALKDGVLARSNTVIVGLPWEPRTFNPYRGLDSASYFAQSMVHASLMRYDKGGKLKPGLAKDYSVSADGLTYTFNLRENLRFSDGTPVTGNDVVESIKATKAPGSPFRGNLESIESCDARSPLQAVLHLSARNLSLMSRMTDLRIVPARCFEKSGGEERLGAERAGADHVKSGGEERAGADLIGSANSEDLARHPIGCGPFRLRRWDPGLEIVFEANPYFYGEKAKSKFVIWRVVPDGNLLSAALRRGDVDVARIDGRSDLDLLSKTASVRVKDVRSNRTIFLAFNTDKEPYSHEEFRKAIAMMINREAIARSMYRGYAVVPPTDFPRTLSVYDKTARVWPFDPKGVKPLMEKCGFEECKDGWYRVGAGVRDVGIGSEVPNAENERLSFKIITIRDFADVAQVVAADLQNAKVGVRVELVEYSTMKDKYLTKGNFDCVLFSRTQGPDPDCRLTWAKNGPLNYARYKDDDLDRLVNEGYYAVTEEERRMAYKQIQELLADRLPCVFLVQPDLTIAYKSYVKGLGEGIKSETGLPWDNPLFDAKDWHRASE